MIPADLLALLCCPQCRSGLTFDERTTTLVCQGCGLLYEVKDGIPILIPPASTESAGD